MVKINDTVTGKIHDNILADLQKDGAIFDSSLDSFEYNEDVLMLESNGEVESKNVKYIVSIDNIINSIDKVKGLVEDASILKENGVTISNALLSGKAEKAKELGCLDTYNKFYAVYPEDYRHEYEPISSVDIWNNLISNTNEIKDNRFEDYTKFYNRVYRLINLIEINAPNIIVENEMKLTAKALLNKDNFKGINKEKDADLSKEQDELDR